MSFTTVANCTLFLNKDVLTPFEEGMLGMAIPMVDGIINNYCGLNLLATDYVAKRFNGSGLGTLDLKLYPINTVTEVKIRDDESTFTDVTTSIYTQGDTYLYLDQYADITTFTSGTHNIYCTFNAGFTEANMPADLSYAASYLATINFRKITNELIGIEEGRFEEATFKFDSIELPVLVKRVLDRYRVVTVY